MIKHLIKIDDELFGIPLKVYNHLEQQKQRADELEKRWSELKKTLLLYKDIPQSTQSFDTVFELMKEMEFKKEDNNA